MEDKNAPKINEENEKEIVGSPPEERDPVEEPGAAPESIPEALPISGEVFSPLPAKESGSSVGAPNFFRKALPWVMVGLVALILGFVGCYISLYRPIALELRETQTQLSTTMAQLAQTENEFQVAQNALKQRQEELESIQVQLTNTTFNQALAEVQTNVAFARLALVTKDLLTARQELSAADGNLKILTALLEIPETSTALVERLTSIRAKLTNDSAMALEELRILSENLTRIERR